MSIQLQQIRQQQIMNMHKNNLADSEVYLHSNTNTNQNSNEKEKKKQNQAGNIQSEINLVARSVASIVQLQEMPDYPQNQGQLENQKEFHIDEENIIDKIRAVGQSGDVVKQPNPEIVPKLQQKNIQIADIEPYLYTIPSVRPQRPIPKQCSFCAQFLGEEYFERTFQCQHVFCKSCLHTYIETQVKNFKIITCPNGNCSKPLDENSKYFNSIQQPIRKKYQIIKFRSQISKDKNFILCPSQTCQKGYIQLPQGNKSDQSVSPPQGKCKQCKISFCLSCKMKSHPGKCQNFQQKLLKNKYKYKKCFGCSRIVQRNQGCPHMTCKCGAQFCYYCGKKWVSPHRCVRFLAGGELVTDKIATLLSCMRPEKYEYEENFVGFLIKMPFYIVGMLILILYLGWCLAVLAGMIGLILAGSSIAGYFALQYHLIKSNRKIGCVFFVLFIFLFPIGFIIGWFGAFGVVLAKAFPKYLELALSARLFPCFLC